MSGILSEKRRAQKGENEMAIYRQGDVLIMSVETTPSQAVQIALENGRIILAHGEVTGHAHVVVGDAELLTTAESADRWLKIGSGGATVVHEEHGSIALAEGIYRVRRQREYTPEAIRNVAD